MWSLKSSMKIAGCPAAVSYIGISFRPRAPISTVLCSVSILILRLCMLALEANAGRGPSITEVGQSTRLFLMARILIPRRLLRMTSPGPNLKGSSSMKLGCLRIPRAAEERENCSDNHRSPVTFLWQAVSRISSLEYSGLLLARIW